jgi:hypothetical protein
VGGHVSVEHLLLVLVSPIRVLDFLRCSLMLQPPSWGKWGSRNTTHGDMSLLVGIPYYITASAFRLLQTQDLW